MVNHIFSGEYSKKMWKKINEAKTISDLKDALYLVCCRLQELEATLDKKEASPDLERRAKRQSLYDMDEGEE